MPKKAVVTETQAPFAPKVGDPVKVTQQDGSVVAGIVYEVPKADTPGFDTYRVEVISVRTEKLRTLKLEQLAPATQQDVNQTGIEALAKASATLTPEAIIAREAAETETKYVKMSLNPAQAEDEDEDEEFPAEAMA